MSSAAARPLSVSTDNYSSLISIIAWVFLVTTFLGVVARLSTRVAISRRFKTDDLLIVVALVRQSRDIIVLLLKERSDSKHRIRGFSFYGGSQWSRPAHEFIG